MGETLIHARREDQPGHDQDATADAEQPGHEAGEDTDDETIGLDALLQTLSAENDAARPVPVITIAYGPDGGADVLSQISEVTDAATYTASDPRQVRDVFLDAVGQRVCRPDCAASPPATASR